ncbi:MAG TPA: PGPGW domain-containing protein [Candidatus Dormibacteraeota bacterium]
MEVRIVKSRLNQWLAPLPRPLRRLLILVLGTTVVLFGVLLLVLPGPGILVIIVGLAILATEFAWAEALLATARRRAARVGKKFGGQQRQDGSE